MKYQVAILFAFTLFQAQTARAVNPKAFSEIAQALEEATSLRKQALQATSAEAAGKLLRRAAQIDTDAVLMQEFLRADPQLKIHQLAKETLFLHNRAKRAGENAHARMIDLPGHRSHEPVSGYSVVKQPKEMRAWIQENKNEIKALAKHKYSPADKDEITQLRNDLMTSSPGQRAFLYRDIANRLAKGNQNIRKRATEVGTRDENGQPGEAFDDMVNSVEGILAAGSRPARPRRISDDTHIKIRDLLLKDLQVETKRLADLLIEDLDQAFFEQPRVANGRFGPKEQKSRMSIYAELVRQAGIRRDAAAQAIDQIEKLLTQSSKQSAAADLEESLMKSVATKNRH